ncbi:MAG: hypothetical protein IPM51_15270 [Sphingobacteriaceae bacterium]|nr:hypothetical protein [Sphingobacteriaceae bacterium]
MICILRIADSVYSTAHSSMDLFTYGKRFMESSSYSIKAVNQKVKSFIDSVN